MSFSLADLRDELGTLPEPLVREVGRQLAARLAELHAADGVHGALRPETVLVPDEGELVLGEAPGAGERADDLAALGRMLDDLAVPARSPFFAEVLARLRGTGAFGSAEDVLRVLDEGERGAWWSAQRRPQRPEPPHIAVDRSGGPFRGRADAVARLSNAWDAACAGRGRAVSLEGASGIGKTRLVDAFVSGLGDDAYVLYGSYPPSGAADALAGAVVDAFDAGDLQGALDPYLDATPALVPRFAAFLRGEPSPPGAEPLRDDVLDTLFFHLARTLASRAPTVWIVDDLHFAPVEARARVAALARAVEGRRLVLIVATRPGTEPFEGMDRLVLNGLSASEVAGLFGPALPIGEAIRAHSDGVPFRAVEMLRFLESERVLARDASGAWVQEKEWRRSSLPCTPEDLVDARVRRLTAEQRDILEIGAVQGLVFDAGLVASVLDRSKLDTLRELARLERDHELVRSCGARVGFAQNQVPEVIYREMMPDRRAEYHALLAEASARIGATITGEAACFLASHHLHGSRPAQAATYLDAALDHFGRTQRHGAAAALAARALDAPRLLEGAGRIRVLLRQAEHLGVAGRHRKERNVLGEAFRLAEASGDPGLRARVRQALGRHLNRTSRNDVAEPLLREGLELARVAGDELQEMRVIGSLGAVAYDRGHYDDALHCHRRHLALARALGSEKEEGVATVNLGNVHYRLGEYETARNLHETFLGMARKLGKRDWEAAATGNLGIVLMNLGLFDEARRRNEEQLRLARETGHRRTEAVALGNLGIVCKEMGELASSRDHYERQLMLSAEVAYPQGRAMASCNLGVLLVLLGQRGEARDHVEHALEIALAIEDRRIEAASLARLGLLAGLDGDLDAAEDLHGQALSLRRRIRNRLGIGESLFWLACLRARRGDREAAAAAFREALDMGRAIRSPSLTVLPAAHLGALGHDPEAAAELLGVWDGRIGVLDRMEARFALWKGSGDARKLTEAGELLDRIVDHAPPDCRTSMVRDVPLHAELAAARARSDVSFEEASS